MPIAIQIGDRARHRGTKQWGTVLEVRPQADGTAELVLQRDPPRFPGDFEGTANWATYHLDKHVPKETP